MGGELKPKSIFDGMQVKDTMFACNKEQPAPSQKNRRDMEVVSKCPQCGCPIYGPTRIPADETPTIIISCDCGVRSAPIK